MPFNQRLIPWLGFLVLMLVCCRSRYAGTGALRSEPTAPQLSRAIDLGDISILFPPPGAKTMGVDADHRAPFNEGRDDLWMRLPTEAVSDAQFETLMALAKDRKGIDFAVTEQQRPISFGSAMSSQPYYGFDASQRKMWHISSLRFDPCPTPRRPDWAQFVAQGSAPFEGCTPEIRLVAQPYHRQIEPLTAKVRGQDYDIKPPQGRVALDYLAHFFFRLNAQQATQAAIRLRDMRRPECPTAGLPLGVHPCLTDYLARGGGAGFHLDVAQFVRDFAKTELLHKIAFMGTTKNNDPWIFMQVLVDRDRVTINPIKTVIRPEAKTPAQQSTPFFQGHTQIASFHAPRNRIAPLGKPEQSRLSRELDRDFVGTFVSHAPEAQAEAAQQLVNMLDRLENPTLTHVFNVDCVSCHKTSTLRYELKNSGSSIGMPKALTFSASAARFEAAAGLSAFTHPRYAAFHLSNPYRFNQFSIFELDLL